VLLRPSASTRARQTPTPHRKHHWDTLFVS
jgi:hypothetical protein